MSSGKVLLSILAGVAVGAVLGVLFAPDKGWNTRKRIAKKGEDHAEDLKKKILKIFFCIFLKNKRGKKEKFEEFLDSISEKVDEVKEDVADISEKNKSKGSESKKEAKTGTV